MKAGSSSAPITRLILNDLKSAIPMRRCLTRCLPNGASLVGVAPTRRVEALARPAAPRSAQSESIARNSFDVRPIGECR